MRKRIPIIQSNQPMHDIVRSLYCFEYEQCLLSLSVKSSTSYPSGTGTTTPGSFPAPKSTIIRAFR